MTRTAKHWGTRPSLLLGERDDVVAFALDEALAVSDDIALRWASEQKPKDPIDWLQPGERLATEDDYQDEPVGMTEGAA